jgi:hypothetical protein
MVVSQVGRSVLDYETEDEIREALLESSYISGDSSDWKLTVPDPYAEEQTVDGELQRLLALKSYLMLDTEQEEAFDRLTEEACRIYQVPKSLISLIDLGRQYYFGGVSGSEPRETTRSVAFCAHTILAKVSYKGLGADLNLNDCADVL